MASSQIANKKLKPPVNGHKGGLESGSSSPIKPSEDLTSTSWETLSQRHPPKMALNS